MDRQRVLFTCLMLLPIAVRAQDADEPRTLFNEDIELSGGFLSLTPRFTNVFGSDVALFGMSAGVEVDGWLRLGLTGTWSGTPIKNDLYLDHIRTTTSADLNGLELRYGYGGIVVEPVLHARSVVHIATPVAFGFGAANYSYPSSSSSSHDTNRRTRIDGQGIWVIEPGVEIEVSIIKSLRIGLGGSYLHTSELDLPNTSADALRNFTARFSVKIGSFGRVKGEQLR